MYVLCLTYRYQQVAQFLDAVVPAGWDGICRRMGISARAVSWIPWVVLCGQGVVVVSLYNTVWTPIAYVNLQEEKAEAELLGTYIKYADRLCNALQVRHWTIVSAAHRFRHLQRIERFTAEIVGQVSSRQKRGVFSFVGKISKMLFGTLDENDAAYYNEQIKRFERDSENTTTLLKQQVYVVKSTERYRGYKQLIPGHHFDIQ